MTEEQWGVQVPGFKKPWIFRSRALALSYLKAAEGNDFVVADGTTRTLRGLKLLRRQITDWEEVDLGT